MIEGQEGAPQDPRMQDKEVRVQQADHLFNSVHRLTTLSEEQHHCVKYHRLPPKKAKKHKNEQRARDQMLASAPV